MNLDLGQVRFDLWTVVFLPVVSLVAASVVRALRADAIALRLMRDLRVSAIDRIESDRATPILVAIIAGLLPVMARSYASASISGTAAEDGADREQELRDRLSSEKNVGALCSLLQLGGPWNYLKESHKRHVRSLHRAGVSGGIVGLLLLPIVADAVTPGIDVLSLGFQIGLGIALVAAVTIWCIAELTAIREQNAFSRIVEECE